LEFAVKIAGVVPEAAAALGLIVSVAAIAPGFIGSQVTFKLQEQYQY
jgi:hypothetical protein